MCDHRDLKSISYSIPNELFVNEPISISEKKYVISPLLSSDFINFPSSDGCVLSHYDLSLFAFTNKTNGWDCLRYYEILANGCIPIIEQLDNCPRDTLTSLPKQLLLDAYKELLPWKNTEEQRQKYPIYCDKLFQFARNNCSVSAETNLFLHEMSSPCKTILMLTCDSGVNYTRELTWIGLKRRASVQGYEAVEWPTIDYLYDSFPEDQLCELYENGITYSRRLPANAKIELSEQEVIDSIKSKKWDIIIYGKVGPDELSFGSIPQLPFWEHVFKRYSRDEIVFWYGGDGMQDMTNANRYSDHLVRHCQYGRCFVRELIRWNGFC
jgi:hypothetical protein